MNIFSTYPKAVAVVFDSEEQMVSAAERLRELGCQRLEAYSPYPIEALEDLIPAKTRIPLIAFISGLAGGIGGYYMQYWTAVVQYPLNVGSRPLNSWPSFIPITFELTILCASLAVFAAFFVFTRLPELYHPIFGTTVGDRLSDDRFVLTLEQGDPQFESAEVQEMLSKFQAEVVPHAHS